MKNRLLRNEENMGRSRDERDRSWETNQAENIDDGMTTPLGAQKGETVSSSKGKREVIKEHNRKLEYQN